MGINGFEEVGLEWLLPQRESPCLRFCRKVRFEGGEREADLLMHAHWTNSPLSFLVFFLFFSVFVLIFFSFPLALFFYKHCKICSVFFTPSTGYGKSLFIAPAVTSVLRSYPLTAFVWSGCTCQPHCATQTLARQRRTRFVPLCVVAFPATKLIPSLLTLRACTQRFPLKLPLLGGLSSQQDVPPKRDLSRNRE